MQTTVLDAFERLVTDFSWRRLVSLALFALVVIAAIVAFDRYTGYFRMMRLERATQLLTELSVLGQQELVGTDTTLARIRAEIVGQLESSLRPVELPSPFTPTIIKGLTGAAPWLMLMIGLLIAGRGSASYATAALGVFLFVLLFGGIGMLIPTFSNRWINYILYPVLSFMIGFVAAMRYGRRSKPAT